MPREIHSAPEVTADRQGFLHPYHVDGGVAEVRLRIILHNFGAAGSATQARGCCAARPRPLWPNFQAHRSSVETKPQYRNMADEFAPSPGQYSTSSGLISGFAETLNKTIIRGGTDGSRSPSSVCQRRIFPQGNTIPHSPLEWACLEGNARGRGGAGRAGAGLVSGVGRILDAPPSPPAPLPRGRGEKASGGQFVAQLARKLIASTGKRAWMKSGLWRIRVNLRPGGGRNYSRKAWSFAYPFSTRQSLGGKPRKVSLAKALVHYSGGRECSRLGDYAGLRVRSTHMMRKSSSFIPRRTTIRTT